MKTYCSLIAAMAVLYPIGYDLSAAVIAKLTPPKAENSCIRFYRENNRLRITDFPASQNGGIARIPLMGMGTSLPPGKYCAYIQLDDVKMPVPLEVAIANDVQVIIPVNTNTRYIGPIHFSASQSFRTIDIRAAVNLSIRSLIVTDFPEPSIPAVIPTIPSQKNTVWIEAPDDLPYPYWFQIDKPLRYVFRSSGTGKAKVEISLVDYHHCQVAEKTVEVDLGTFGSLVLPTVKKYGPYLAKFRISYPDGRQSELQKIFAVVSPPPSQPNLMLGGHGNSALILAMGGARERLWDSNQTLLWKNVEKEKGTFRWSGYLPPKPLRSIVVLETRPQWAQDTFANPDYYFQYVDALTKQYRGQVEIYEIFNEPYTEENEHPEKIATIVRRCAEIIRRNDPSAGIALGGPPEEIPPGLGIWEKLVKARAFDAVDAVTGHFYVGAGGTHPLDQDLRFDAYINAVKNLLSRHGYGQKQLIDSESGICPMETFYAGQPPCYGLWGGKGFSERAPVPYLVGTPMYARLLLLHLYHRIPWMIYHTDKSYGNSWAMVDGDLTPLPASVAITQAVRLLQGFEPAERASVPSRFFGIAFRHGNQDIAVFWAIGLKSGETLWAASSGQAQVKLLDMFGNSLPAATEYEVGSNPVYVKGATAAVKSFFSGLRVRSQIDKEVAARNGRIDQPVCRKGYHGFTVTVPPGAAGCSPDCLYDDILIGSGTPADSWTAASTVPQETAIVYEWTQPQTINWITVGWATGYRPEKYKVEWFDGNRWILAQGTWNGWRKPNENTESYPVWQFKTQKLRFSFIPRTDGSTRTTEFAAYFAPRLTPPITEMQEVYNRNFTPDRNGFLVDWLVCGPFPAMGNRYGSNKPAMWNDLLLKNHYHYGRQYDDTTLHPKVDQTHFVKFEDNSQTKWRVGRGTIHWTPYHTKDGYVDLAETFQKSDIYPDHAKPIENCYGYAVCYITMKKEFTGTMAVGSDDGYKIMVDNTRIAEKVIYRGAAKDQDKYTVKIKAGEHRLLVRVHNDINGHGFFLRFLNQDGTPFRDYHIKIVP